MLFLERKLGQPRLETVVGPTERIANNVSSMVTNGADNTTMHGEELSAIKRSSKTTADTRLEPKLKFVSMKK